MSQSASKRAVSLEYDKLSCVAIARVYEIPRQSKVSGNSSIPIIWYRNQMTFVRHIHVEFIQRCYI